MAHPGGAYLRFCRMAQPEIFLLLAAQDASLSKG